jgi:hypothetical protein
MLSIKLVRASNLLIYYSTFLLHVFAVGFRRGREEN